MRFEGKTVLVTGAAGGIGQTLTTTFVTEGARVAVTDLDTAMLTTTADARFDGDLTDRAFCDALPRQVHDRFGRLDILVNNAGGAPPAESATVSPRFNEKIVALNLLAPMLFSQAVHDIMQAQDDGGVIVNIASVSGTRANPKGVAYGAAKAGLINMTETLAHEWGPKIRVIAPVVGMIVTEDAHLFYGDQAGIDAIGAMLPLGRMGEPADVADVVLFCVSPLARWMSGCAIPVDGGGEGAAYLDAATGEVNQT